MYRNEYQMQPYQQVGANDYRYPGGFGPVGAGLLGFGLGYLGGELFDGPGFGGYPGAGYGAGFGGYPGVGYGAGFGGYPGVGYGAGFGGYPRPRPGFGYPRPRPGFGPDFY